MAPVGAERMLEHLERNRRGGVLGPHPSTILLSSLAWRMRDLAQGSLGKAVAHPLWLGQEHRTALNLALVGSQSRQD